MKNLFSEETSKRRPPPQPTPSMAVSLAGPLSKSVSHNATIAFQTTKFLYIGPRPDATQWSLTGTLNV